MHVMLMRGANMSTIPPMLRRQPRVGASGSRWQRYRGYFDHAQPCGDVVFIELPEVGKSTECRSASGCGGKPVKAASDIYTPICEVIAINDGLSDSPESVNSDQV
jgi:hypothetical protein